MVKDKIDRCLKKEHGEVMIEGMIIMILTMFILIWLLGLGFLYYQRYTTTTVTNDAAVKIASTYNNPTSDIVMGYVTTEELSERDLYRCFTNTSSFSNLKDTNEDRAASYVKYKLDKANFMGTVKEVDVKLELVLDSAVRRHVEVTTTCTYRTPFGDVLRMFGMGREHTYSTTARADCTDFADYISTVNSKEIISKGKLADFGFVSSVGSFVNKLVEYFNHKFS